MSNTVPLPDCAPEDAGRVCPRKNLFLMATLVVAGASHAVRVRNLSASGALVDSSNLPKTGSSAFLLRGSLHAEGVLVWQADGRAGLRFANPINLVDWIPGASGQDQMEVDRAIAEARANRFTKPSSAAVLDSIPEIEPGLLRRTADELAFVSRRLEALGNDLAGDPQVIARHTTNLQELDLSVQILGHVARLLVAYRPEDVVKSISMADLRRRLQHNSLI